jgi:hypothetical protein
MLIPPAVVVCSSRGAMMATIAIGERVGHLYHRREGDQDHFVYRAIGSFGRPFRASLGWLA